MPKKWGYKGTEARIFDLDEDGQLPAGWHATPDAATDAATGKAGARSSSGKPDAATGKKQQGGKK